MYACSVLLACALAHALLVQYDRDACTVFSYRRQLEI